MPLVIATPGAPLSTPKPGGSINGIKRAHALGIRAMEMEWVQSVPKNVEHMEEIHALAKSLDFTLTVHAPYFVNLNSEEAEKIAASKKRILDALTMAQIAGAVSVCVHAAFNGTNGKALDNVLTHTESIMTFKEKLFPDVNLAYETMGKGSQFGTIEEVLKVSKEFDNVPCIDISHMFARTGGGYNSVKEWNEMFDLVEKYLGKKAMKKLHLHLSGIAYGPKGEKHHLEFSETDFQWKEYVKVLHKRGIGGVLVCESPSMEKDTMLLQKTYESL